MPYSGLSDTHFMKAIESVLRGIHGMETRTELDGKNVVVYHGERVVASYPFARFENAVEVQIGKVYEKFTFRVHGDNIYVHDGRGGTDPAYPIEGVLKAAIENGILIL